MNVPSRWAIILIAGGACRGSTRWSPRSHSRSRIRTISLGRRWPSPPIVTVVVLPRRRSRVTTRRIARRRSFALRVVATRFKPSRRRWRRAPHPEIVVVPSRPQGGRRRVIAEIPGRRGRPAVVTLPPSGRRVIIEARISWRRVTRVFAAVWILPKGRRIVPGGRNTINERRFTSRVARTTSEQSSKCLSDIIRLPYCDRIERLPVREVVGALPNEERMSFN